MYVITAYIHVSRRRLELLYYYHVNMTCCFEMNNFIPPSPIMVQAGLHPFLDTCHLQLEHATLFVITDLESVMQGSHKNKMS